MGRKRFIKADIATLFFVVVSAFFFVLTLIRIKTIPVTHDEAFTYYTYIDKSFQEIYSYKDLYANNHFLNTILSKLIVGVFGNSMVTIRLANLMGLLVFLLYAHKLLKYLFNSSQPWMIATMVLISFNAYMLEFWGLCRGYGLALTFTLASCYHLLRYSKGGIRHLIFATVFAMAAVYANFTLLNFFLAYLAGVIVLLFVNRENKKKILLSLLVLASGTALLAWLIYKPASILHNAQDLFYGGDTGIVEDTFDSLILRSFYIQNAPLRRLLAHIPIIVIVISFVYWLVGIIRKGELVTYGIILWVLLCVPIVLAVMQHHFLGTKFQIGRTGLFIYLIFMLHFAYWMHHIFKQGYFQPAVVVATVCVVCTATFVRNFNTTHTTDWEYDKHNLTVLEKIIQETPEGVTPTLKLSWPLIPSMLYHTNTDEFAGKLMPVENRGESLYQDSTYDYVYYSGWPVLEDINNIQGSFVTDTAFTDIGNYLYKREK